MDKKALNETQLQHIKDLERDRLVDGNFRLCHSLKGGNGGLFLLDLIKVFMTDVHSVVNEITRALEQPVVDFKVMYCQCIKIKGGCSCIGACNIRDACSRLCMAIESKSKEGCTEALENLKRQYNILADRLENFMKIEQQISLSQN